MKTLHRAFCSCNHWRYQSVDEKTVFFETFHDEHAGERLRTLLANVWGVPESSVIIYNVYSEAELLRDSLDDSAAGGESSLFEIGWNQICQRPRYITCWPLMLVSPRTHERLVNTFINLGQTDTCRMREVAHG